MKTIKLAPLALAGIAATLLASAPVNAETVTTTTKTTSYSGVVSSIDPSASTIILKSETAAAPVTYNYSKETTFVDSQGNVVSYEAIRNAPVTVEYETDGGRTIVRRVVQTGPAIAVPSVPSVAVPSDGVIRREKTVTHTEREDD